MHPISLLKLFLFFLLRIMADNHEITLESVLDVKSQHYDNFTIYLHHTYCIENLYFWQDVHRYKLQPTHKKYKTMIENYIIANAPYEINIPCEMRQDILDHHTPHCFDEAAESILELLRVNSFLPWYQDRYFLPKRHRNSLSPSMSFPGDIMSQHTRTSFSSLRASSSLFQFDPHHTKLTSLFQRKRQAFMIRMKKSFVTVDTNKSFSWLAKK
jgi:hypothetical protein